VRRGDLSTEVLFRSDKKEVGSGSSSQILVNSSEN